MGAAPAGKRIPLETQKHQARPQPARNAGCGAVNVKNIVNTQKSLLTQMRTEFLEGFALTCPKRKGEDGYKNSLHHLLLPNKEENGTLCLMNWFRTRHLLCGS